jgi:hypothetical protein
VPISDPTDISGCVLWLAADDIVGLSDGDPVSTWVDGSGTGDATSSGSGRPTYQTNELNGLPIVRFDGVNDYLVFTDRTLGEWSAFFVVAAVGDCGLLGDADFAAPQARYGQSGSNVLSTYDGTNNPQSSELDAEQGDWVIVGFTRSGTTVTFWEGNTSRGTGTNSGTQTWSSLGAHRPLDSSPANFLTGDIAEVVLYDSGLDNTERGDLVTYLTAKWFGDGGGGDVTVFLTGSAATASTGTLSPSTTLALSGSAGNCAAGTTSPALSCSPSGQVLNASTGEVGTTGGDPVEDIPSGRIVCLAGADRSVVSLSGADLSVVDLVGADRSVVALTSTVVCED